MNLTGNVTPYLWFYEIAEVAKRGLGATNPKYGATAGMGCVSTLTERLQETLKPFALSKILVLLSHSLDMKLWRIEEKRVKLRFFP